LQTRQLKLNFGVITKASVNVERHCDGGIEVRRLPLQGQHPKAKSRFTTRVRTRAIHKRND
jgi:hypothetical protein